MTYLNADEVGRVLLNYIGSEEYNEAVSSVPEGQNSFLAGYAIAGLVVLSKCQRYIGREEGE